MWIDLTIILVLCICSAVGFKKGMLESIFSIIIFFASLYLTYLIHPYLSNLIVNLLKLDNLDISLVQNSNALSSFVESNNSLLLFIKNILHIDESSLLKNILSFGCNIIGFIILSIVVTKLLRFCAKKISSAVKKMAILGSFDRMCGVLFGFVKGLIMISILCFVISGLNDFDLLSSFFSVQISNSSLFYVFKSGTQYIITTMTQLVS